MTFSQALESAKAGKGIARHAFRDSCHIMAQFPDAGSKMTKPYLYMVKRAPHVTDHHYEDVFPVDLSCESIFAEDWYEIE